MERDCILTQSVACSVLQKIGINPEDWFAWRRKWRDLRGNASRRGLECKLTFRQYMFLVRKAGITSPQQIGRASTKFQMGRIGDSGDYEIGNCRFISARINLDERAANGGNASIGRKLSRRFRVDSPKRNTYLGMNLRAFCTEYGLDYSCMKSVCSGAKPHHKGWTGRYESRS